MTGTAGPTGIPIRTATIRLDQLLKLANLVDGGGLAKLRIQGGEVQVNGEVELRRGRKLRLGDRVEIDGAQVEVVAAER